MRRTSRETERNVVATYINAIKRGLGAIEAQTLIASEHNLHPRTVRVYTRAMGVVDVRLGKYDHLAIGADPVAVNTVPPVTSGLGKVVMLSNQLAEVALPEPEIPERASIEPTNYILTGWELRTKVDFVFLSCLKQIAKRYNAELLLTPCYRPDLDYLPAELRAFRVLTEDFQFNDNLLFKYVETHALSSSPLQGWKGVSDSSVIIPGLIMELVTLPTEKSVKQLMSAGCIGHIATNDEHYTFAKNSPDKEYRETFRKRWNLTRSQMKPTEIARTYVKPSAVFISVLDDKRFLTRYISKDEADCVYDLDTKYTTGKPQTIHPAALNVGDTHAYQHDPLAVDRTLDQIRALKPKLVILNDFTDAISANYHEKDKASTFHQAPSVVDEMLVTVALLKRFRNVCLEVGARLAYKKSNHCDFFEKYLDAGEHYWRMNRNYQTCIALQHERHLTGLKPIQLLIDFPGLGVEFWNDDKPNMVGKVSVIHGHEPISGRPATFKAQSQHYNYLSQNHTHSPTVYRNAVCGGLTAKLDQAYLRGISGWLHCNTIIHEDGTQQLLAIIDGEDFTRI